MTHTTHNKQHITFRTIIYVQVRTFGSSSKYLGFTTPPVPRVESVGGRANDARVNDSFDVARRREEGGRRANEHKSSKILRRSFPPLGRHGLRGETIGVVPIEDRFRAKPVRARARRSREDDAERLSHRAQRIHLEETGGDDAIHGLSRGRTETRDHDEERGDLSVVHAGGGGVFGNGNFGTEFFVFDIGDVDRFSGTRGFL